MVSYLLLCRSLTYAQRTVHVLEQADIKCNAKRTPRNLSHDGCGYCVVLNCHSINYALERLREENLYPKQIYERRSDGSYREVAL